MAAGDVVGEDFQLRLVVGLGLVGQQQRPRHHLGVGLLRIGTDDDAALEHRMGAVVDHGAEHFAAGAVRHRMVHQQRGVGVLRALQQVDAIGLDPRALAGKGDGRLIAADAGARGHAKGVEMGVGAERHDRGRDVDGIGGVLDQPDLSSRALSPIATTRESWA